MTTNKDAHDCLDELCDWAVQGHIYNSVLERCRDTLINALQTQAELVEALRTAIKKSPFRPSATGITVEYTFEQVKAMQQVLARAEGKE